MAADVDEAQQFSEGEYQVVLFVRMGSGKDSEWKHVQLAHGYLPSADRNPPTVEKEDTVGKSR